MHFEIFLRRSDIDPISIHGVRQHRLFMLQQRGEKSAFERVGFSFRHVREHGRFENVDSRVDGVARDFIGPGLFDEALDPAIGIRFHQAIGGRIFHGRQHDGSDGFSLTMACDDSAQVQSRQDIAIEDDSRGVDMFFGVFKCTPGPEGGTFDGIPDPDAIVRPILQQVFYFARLIGKTKDDFTDPRCALSRSDREEKGNWPPAQLAWAY